MKTKLSISIEGEMLSKLEEQMNSGKFRNKSHAIEYAVKKLLEKKVVGQGNG